MWNWLFASDAARQPIKIALQPPDVNGNGKVFAFTANYRLELGGRTGGIYFIGGPGWIYRTASLSKPIPAGTPIPLVIRFIFGGDTIALVGQ